MYQYTRTHKYTGHTQTRMHKHTSQLSDTYRRTQTNCVDVPHIDQTAHRHITHRHSKRGHTTHRHITHRHIRTDVQQLLYEGICSRVNRFLKEPFTVRGQISWTFISQEPKTLNCFIRHSLILPSPYSSSWDFCTLTDVDLSLIWKYFIYPIASSIISVNCIAFIPYTLDTSKKSLRIHICIVYHV